MNTDDKRIITFSEKDIIGQVKIFNTWKEAAQHIKVFLYFIHPQSCFFF
jgi:hypothetical protein